MIPDFSLTKLTVLTTLCTGLALADAFPASLLAPNGVLTDKAITVLSQPPNPVYPVKFAFGTGGGFEATVDGINTIVWCVDAEEDIKFPTSYHGDIVQLSTLVANSADVRYGSVTGATWQNSLPGDNDALARFEMAAYLVSQYGNFPSGPSSSNAMNQEIQTAIWEIMWNSSVNPQGGITYAKIAKAPSGIPQATFDAAINDPTTGYIALAKQCIDNLATCAFNPANYAVVSGAVKSSGALKPTGYQTYIVQLTPEPASIALLGVVGAWVFFARRRLRKAS